MAAFLCLSSNAGYAPTLKLIEARLVIVPRFEYELQSWRYAVQLAAPLVHEFDPRVKIWLSEVAKMPFDAL